MNRPRIPKSSYYKEQYHRLMDRILREKERRIIFHTKRQPKMDIGEQDSDFIPKEKDINND
jgi:hypothetical protein